MSWCLVKTQTCTVPYHYFVTVLISLTSGNETHHSNVYGVEYSQARAIEGLQGVGWTRESVRNSVRDKNLFPPRVLDFTQPQLNNFRSYLLIFPPPHSPPFPSTKGILLFPVFSTTLSVFSCEQPFAPFQWELEDKRDLCPNYFKPPI